MLTLLPTSLQRLLKKKKPTKKQPGRFAGSGHSLVEEGEQVAHHHQRGPRHAQQDLTDALRPLVHVLDPCGGGKGAEKKGHVIAVRL